MHVGSDRLRVIPVRARCPDLHDATGWVDMFSGGERSVGQHPYVQRESKPSAPTAGSDCVMQGALHKKGRVLWNQRFFIISPQKISPENPVSSHVSLISLKFLSFSQAAALLLVISVLTDCL